MNVSAVGEAASGNKSQRGGYSEQAQNRQACVEGKACTSQDTPELLCGSRFPNPRRWHSGSWARQVAGPQQPRQGGWGARARPLVGRAGCAPRGWEHGACESPFLGQAGGDCGAGGAFLAGRAAGINVFPTWPRVPRSARSHGQDAPAATPAPAASFPQNRGGGGRWRGERNWVSRGGRDPRTVPGSLGATEDGTAVDPWPVSVHPVQPAHGGWGGSVGVALLARSPVTSVPWDPRRHLLLFFPSCRVGQALRLNEAAMHPEGSGEGGSWKKPHPVPHSLGWRTALAKANGTVSSDSHAVLVPGPGPWGKLRLRGRSTQSSLCVGGSWRLSLQLGSEALNESLM